MKRRLAAQSMKAANHMRFRALASLSLYSLFAGALTLSPPSFAGEQAPARALTVKDAVQMTTIVAPPARLAAYVSQDFSFSKDGSKFFYVTEQSDLSTNQNIYRLVVVKEETVRSILSGAAAPIGPDAANAIIRSSLNKVAFDKPVWAADGKSIHFIGWFGDPERDGQLFALDTDTAEMTQLTFHDAPVESFAFNPVDGSVLFASMDIEPLVSLHEGVELAGVNHAEVAVTRFRNASKPALYIQRKADSPPQKVIGAPEAGTSTFDLHISPNGRYAVFVTELSDIPATWPDRFPFLKSDYFVSRRDGFDPNTMTGLRSMVRQHQLLDLTDMTVRPLYDAPAGLYVAGTSSGVHWREDGESVIIASVANASSPQGRKKPQYETNFSIIEFNIKTNRASRIADHSLYRQYWASTAQAGPDEEIRYYKGSTLLADDLLRVSWRTLGGRQDPDDTFYRRDNGAWLPVSPETALGNGAESASAFEVAITQSIDVRPEISIRTGSNSTFARITDLNPAFDRIQFGRAEIFEWTDPNNRAWAGGLIYPADYEEGETYPLVIQSHGFHRGEYLLGGPYSLRGPFAAQSLAGKGFFVLQIGHAPGHPQDVDQPSADQAGIETAIKILSEHGLVDDARLGMIGWSSTGVQLQQMALCSEYDFSAITIADSYNFGLFGYANQFGWLSPGMGFIEGMTRGKPWGDSLASWVRSNPELHMNRWRTPLRYEQYARNLSSWWGIYVILKRLGKPVEYILFRDASHSLHKPSHRFASMQGNVDGLAYWLKGERDPAPQKEAQYKRWDALREQQAQSARDSKKARSGNNGELTYNCGR